MLGMKNYSRDYIEDCRAKAESGVTAFQQLGAAAKKHADDPALTAAIGEVETAFFDSLLLNLDYCFVHRLAMVEGKDGNPLNEVRILCNSILLNDGVMSQTYPRPHASVLGDKSVKLSPEKSVLKHELGDEIKMTEADFCRISAAFFEEMDRRFAAPDS